MSTENDATQPLRTGSPDPEQPTAPTPRTGADRTEDPTLVVETSGGRAGEGRTSGGDRTSAAHPADGPATAPLRRPVGDRSAEPATAAVPATAPLPAGAAVRRTAGVPVTAGVGATGGTSPATPGAGSAPPSADAPPRPAPPSPAPPSSDAPASSAVDDGARSARPTLRVGTVVWGLVVALVGAGVIAVAAGARFDLELALIGLLALAGLGLVGGSVAAGMRRRR